MKQKKNSKYVKNEKLEKPLFKKIISQRLLEFIHSATGGRSIPACRLQRGRFSTSLQTCLPQQQHQYIFFREQKLICAKLMNNVNYHLLISYKPTNNHSCCNIN